MRGLKRNPWLFGLGVLLAVLVVFGGHARADVNTDQSGSIVIFPKVIADGTRDTIIQITNTSNMSAQAHCFYVNNPSGSCSVTTSQSCRVDTECPGVETCVFAPPGFCSVTSSRSCATDADCAAPACTTCDPNDTCSHSCNEIDFDLFLTAQQPTMWRVSTGRLVSFSSACKMGETCECTVDAISHALKCPGFDPGTGALNSFAVKPAGTDFVGELKCIQTDDSFDTPIAQNSLKGEAIIETIASSQISEYNAIGISAITPNMNADLNLDNVEYNRCPNSLLLNHYADGATDDFFGNTVRIETELTLVPCTELFEQQLPTPARALFSITNEFEQPLSASVNFDCTLNARLSAIDTQFSFSGGLIGSQFAKTRITPPIDPVCLTGDRRGLTCATDTDCPKRLTTAGNVVLGCRQRSGLLGVAEEFHSADERPSGTAAVNLHMEGTRPGVGDIIVLPTP